MCPGIKAECMLHSIANILAQFDCNYSNTLTNMGIRTLQAICHDVDCKHLKN